MPVLKPGSRILFQGDSITDADRARGDDAGLGNGYVFIIAAKLGAQYPERRLEFRNRAISGNKVYELAERWRDETLKLKPDVVSILIGVNDAAAGVPLDAYEEAYEKLLAETVAALPHVRLVLCEPFTLAVGDGKDVAAAWHDDVRQRAKIVEKLAAKYHAPFVRFQKAFDEACKRAPAAHWLWDGVHPTHSGHQVMADEWIRAVGAPSN